MKNIIAFAGSTSKNSINKTLVQYAGTLIQDATMQVEVLDLNDFEMPLFSVDVEKASGYPEKAQLLLGKITNADGLVISLAEHNGAYTAAFKNALDWMSRIKSQIFDNKPMLLMATSDGARGGGFVLDMAKSRFPIHKARIIEHFSLPGYNKNFKDGKIVDSDLNSQLIDKVEHFKTEVHMDIKHECNGKSGRFFIGSDFETLAEMTYIKVSENKIIIDHTEVNPIFKGQGIGYKLMDSMTEFLRKNNIKATTQCSFAASAFAKKPAEYADVLAE